MAAADRWTAGSFPEATHVNSNTLRSALALVLASTLLGAARAQNQALSVTLAPLGGYFEIPPTVNLAPPAFTIEAWITYNDSGLPTGWMYPTIGRKEFTQGSASWFLRVDAGNIGTRTLRLWINGSGGLVHVFWPFAPGALTNWTHVAATYDGSFARIYVNGTQVAQANGTGPLVDIGGATHIGAGDTAPGSADERWNGLLDEVRIWSVARTQSEIAGAMYQQILTAPNLNASYQLDGNGLDSSGHNNNGTALDNPVFVPSTTPVGATSFCTSSTTSHGCVPSIGATGSPSASAGSGFTISVSNVEGQKSGLIFYGMSNAGWTPTTWAVGSTSYLCVKAPVQRTPTQNSGGTLNACDGFLSLDWNAYIATHAGALGTPFGGGETVWAQAWFRDPPAPKTTNLSNGLMFTVHP
jgi:hypothetical protein